MEGCGSCIDPLCGAMHWPPFPAGRHVEATTRQQQQKCKVSRGSQTPRFIKIVTSIVPTDLPYNIPLQPCISSTLLRMETNPAHKKQRRAPVSKNSKRQISWWTRRSYSANKKLCGLASAASRALPTFKYPLSRSARHYVSALCWPITLVLRP